MEAVVDSMALLASEPAIASAAGKSIEALARRLAKSDRRELSAS